MTVEEEIRALQHRLENAGMQYEFQHQEAVLAGVSILDIMTSIESIAKRMEAATEYLRLKTKERQ